MIDKPGRDLRKDAERNRARIIDAARELCATRGLEATLNEVAHHAGLGVGTVYRRFPTKDALFEAIFEDGIDQLVVLAEAGLKADDSWEGLSSFVWKMSELTATDRGLREIAFSRQCCGGRVDIGRDRLHPPVNRLVERAKREGYLRADVAPTDMPLLGLMAGAVSEYAGDINPELWRRYVAILLQGLRCQPKQAPLPVNALSQDEMESAMSTWRPGAGQA
ncbi:TetR/AcrR family transcriptional regulator [Mycobacterium sp. 236(2023)]|uniref:TetR/AcrR family transcriptional regulator n=1 Tax=Mycobacterium sp. 236(2023) TaxID=3038163 RepID=UPI0024151F04|nr:TetR/AcrR family transcriptional regulator [Mycobacterium sp. 236(2023)]MDG4663678.1 TetR/AcrR family transcriptional regulator [Mycobacterium sp. 236(2023)]